MTSEELKQRTKEFALRVIRLVDGLPRAKSADVIVRQLLRSATSVGANYRAACRARSQAEFVSRIGVVEEEADESVYWLELLLEGCDIDEHEVSALLKEATELTAMFTASGKTAKRGSSSANPQSQIRNPK
jgi:four helix bundle protein